MRRFNPYIVAFLLISLIAVMPAGQVWAKERSLPALPIAGKVILIDPGHGGPDGGASSKSGLMEKEVTLKIAKYLRDYLQQAGAVVLLSRETDRDLADKKAARLRKRKESDLRRRVEMIKQHHIDAVISLHLNAFPQSRYAGAQTFYNPIREENKRLAISIQRELVRHLNNTKRTAKQKDDIYLLKESPAPTALVEAGFLSNPREAQLLSTSHYQKQVAEALYYGLIDYYQGAKNK